MARNVWPSMMQIDLRECRNCHSYDAMHREEQTRRARMKMKRANSDGITCIECHQGVAHELSEDFDFDEEREKWASLELENKHDEKTFIQKRSIKHDQFS